MDKKKRVTILILVILCAVILIFPPDDGEGQRIWRRRPCGRERKPIP